MKQLSIILAAALLMSCASAPSTDLRGRSDEKIKIDVKAADANSNAIDPIKLLEHALLTPTKSAYGRLDASDRKRTMKGSRNVTILKLPEFKEGTDVGAYTAAVKNKLCSSGTPRQKLSVAASLVIPKVAAGKTIDVASRFRQELAKSVREELPKLIFGNLADGGSSDEQVMDHYRSAPPDLGEVMRVFGFFDEEANDPVQFYTNLRVETAHTENLVEYVKPYSMYALIDKNRILLVPRASAYISLDRKSGCAWSCKSPDYADQLRASASDKWQEIEYQGFGEKIIPAFIAPEYFELEDGRRFHPLGTFGLSDVRFLQRAFVYMIPADVQRKVFLDERFKASTGRGYGYDSGGNLTPSKALEDQSAAWSSVIENFSTVQEAPSADPQVINYLVSLDLTIACKYARPVTDLVTQ